MVAFFIAFGIVALSALIIWSVCGPKRSYGAQEQVQTETDRQASNNSSDEARSPASVSRPSMGEGERARHKLKDCRDCWTFGIEILGVLGLSAYAYITYQMWQEAQTQTVEANRAWLGYQQAKDSNLPVVIDRLEIAPRFAVEAHYTIENFGHGPAIKVIPSLWVETDTDIVTLKR